MHCLFARHGGCCTVYPAVPTLLLSSVLPPSTSFGRYYFPCIYFVLSLLLSWLRAQLYCAPIVIRTVCAYNSCCVCAVSLFGPIHVVYSCFVIYIIILFPLRLCRQRRPSDITLLFTLRTVFTDSQRPRRYRSTQKKRGLFAGFWSAIRILDTASVGGRPPPAACRSPSAARCLCSPSLGLQQVFLQSGI